MNTIPEKDYSNERKGKMKLKIARLTDDDLMFADGLKAETYGRIHIKHSKAKAQMHRIMESL